MIRPVARLVLNVIRSVANNKNFPENFTAVSLIFWALTWICSQPPFWLGLLLSPTLAIAAFVVGSYILGACKGLQSHMKNK
jgi:hypothetical protein